ncbi:MAG: hypothetical protein RLZZ233_1120 [Verrucomicrobiota bacterium]|jgi:hypothetical protein
MRHEHIQVPQASAPFWESNLFVALLSGLVVWAFGFYCNRASMHRQRADLLLKVQRQLLRQFRDLMILREFYEQYRHLSNGVNQMRLMIHGFSEERILLSEISFALEYIESAADFEMIAEADSEYQCLVVSYRQWTESYLRLRSVGQVTAFDPKTGAAQKNLTAEDCIALRMHADYSAALIQTLDRAVDLNQKAFSVLASSAFSHRKKSRFSGVSRTKVITNAAERLPDEEAAAVRLSKLVVPKSMQFPCAVFAIQSALVVEARLGIKPLRSEIFYVDSARPSVEGAVAHVSFSDAIRVARALNLSHFYWLNGENLLLVDSWLYRASERLGAMSDLISRSS